MASKNKSTTVVNIRKKNLNQIGIKDLKEWLENPDNIYIGRDMTRYVPGAVGSKWGNPFNVKKFGRDECTRMYREHIRTGKQIHENGKTLYESLEELEGKTLGCWCHPEPCHGHILVQLLQEKKFDKNKGCGPPSVSLTSTDEFPPL